MPKLNNRRGLTGFKCRLYAIDTTNGEGKTGLSAATSGLVISTICDTETGAGGVSYTGANIEAVTTIGTWAAPSAGKIRFSEVSSTLHPGLYEVQIADARLAVALSNSLIVQAFGVTGARFAPAEIQLDAVPANLKEVLDVAVGIALQRAFNAIVTCTVGSASTTTSIITSASTLAGTAADQFIGKLVVFASDTTTAALRGQMRVITSSSISATPTLTVSPALTNAPVSTDTFVIT